VQAILIAVSDTGGSWVGWVILAVIFGFVAFVLFGDMRARLRNGLIKRRSRYQALSSPSPSNEGDDWADEQPELRRESDDS
jgi:hypothetical protein